MSDLRPGDILAGKYKVERVLGAGGMGYVVAARHMQLEQMVAMKFIRGNVLESDEARKRFVREAKASARLKSEHVARVFDVGTLESGDPYMVMEYLEGADLSVIAKERGALPVGEAIEYVLQACEALAEAQELFFDLRELLAVAHETDSSERSFLIAGSMFALGLAWLIYAPLHGAQLWVALPDSVRDTGRGFAHYRPEPVSLPGARASVFLGSLAGSRSPVTTFTPLLGAQIDLDPRANAELEIDPTFEHGVLCDEGEVLHRDSVLSPQKRTDRFIPCVSRAVGRIKLDL